MKVDDRITEQADATIQQAKAACRDRGERITTKARVRGWEWAMSV